MLDSVHDLRIRLSVDPAKTGTLEVEIGRWIFPEESLHKVGNIPN